MFISYRRSDDHGAVGRVFDHLEARFGEGNVFLDVDSNMPLGVDFRIYLANQVNNADLLLAVIGPNWCRLMDENVTDPTDFVRLEIEAAIALQKPVVPVLIGAEIPSVEQLPTSIKSMAFLNGMPVDVGSDFRHHMKILCRKLQATYDQIQQQKQFTQEKENSKAQAKELRVPPISKTIHTTEVQNKKKKLLGGVFIGLSIVLLVLGLFKLFPEFKRGSISDHVSHSEAFIVGEAHGDNPNGVVSKGKPPIEKTEFVEEASAAPPFSPTVEPIDSDNSLVNALKTGNSVVSQPFPAQFLAPGPDDPPLKNTHDLVNAYMSASNWEKRLPYIYEGQTLVTKISDYYKEWPDFSVEKFEMKLFQMELDEDFGGPFWVYQITFIENNTDSMGYPLMIRVEDGVLKVDWQIFSEFKDEHFVKFREGKIEAPATFRLVVERVSKYSGMDAVAFSDLDQYLCYEIDPPYGGYRANSEFAFVKKGTEVAETMDTLVGLGDEPLAMILSIDTHDFDHGIRHYVISEVVHQGWFD